jgi:hypothetical protein
VRVRDTKSHTVDCGSLDGGVEFGTSMVVGLYITCGIDMIKSHEINQIHGIINNEHTFKT